MLRLFGRNDPLEGIGSLQMSDDEHRLVPEPTPPSVHYRHIDDVMPLDSDSDAEVLDSGGTALVRLPIVEREPPPPRQSVLVAEHRGGYSHRVESSSGRRSEMRIGSRKRHVVGASQQFGVPLHPTVQAKQNQMYLITTLLPSQNSEQPALINRVFPKELLLRVFSYLDIVTLCRCAQVCRMWNRLAMDGANWQRVDLFYFQKDIKSAVVESLARRCGGFLKELSLKGCENVHDSSMRSFAAKCPNIAALSLSKCKNITDSTCEYLARHCHRLTYLDLENCTSITDDSLKYLSEGCTQLNELNVSWCTNLTDEGISHLLKGCGELQSLIAKGCDAITANCFSGLEKNMVSLRKLNLLSCVNITDETVEIIAAGCPNLEFICLSNCKEVTDRALTALAYGCPMLRDIELASCINVSDLGFIQLSKNCHELERMDLEDCVLITDAAIINLNSGCPNLNSLALSHCENLTDQSLAELCNSHKDCLRVIELDNCPRITDSALEYMRPVENLERIDLYDCQSITKDAIKRFKQNRPDVDVHAYFAPATPPAQTQPPRRGICKCCNIL